MMNYAEESLKLHYALRGKLEITPRAAVDSRDALSLAYTPGVAQPCLEIQKDINKSYELTRRWNTVAVVTDGTAVLGLGDIGPEAGMPVMEGKCVLFKAFGGVDAIPLCLRTKDPDEIVRTIALLAGSFGGINLEDISAPRCFDIEQRLQAAVDIPVFHDDQHGTAVIVLAGLTNALKVAGKDKSARIVINGAGAAGLSVCRLLLSAGYTDITLCDKQGILCPGVTEDMNPYMAAVCERTHAGDHPGGSPRGRRAGGGQWAQRLSQSGEQCVLLPRPVPGRAGRAGQPRDGGHEAGGGTGHRRSCPGRRSERRLHPARRL